MKITFFNEDYMCRVTAEDPQYNSLCNLLFELSDTDKIGLVLDDFFSIKKGVSINAFGYEYLDNQVFIYPLTGDDDFDEDPKNHSYVDVEIFIDIIYEWQEFIQTSYEEGYGVTYEYE